MHIGILRRFCSLVLSDPFSTFMHTEETELASPVDSTEGAPDAPPQANTGAATTNSDPKNDITAEARKVIARRMGNARRLLR
ncbi:MAG TPA: hypothetical protein VJK52_01760 [Candidatus Nanoarchaeia archaeon]|nr:hypothetical protein [Candidatus Nanoarchaeia archaeon]